MSQDKGDEQKHPKHFRAARYFLAFTLVVIIAVTVLPFTYTSISTRGKRYDLNSTSIKDIPHNHVALVFGAGILTNRQPTPYLQHRIETAVALYKAGRVDKLLMSGDNSTVGHNEPIVMENYAIKLGVPAQDLVADYAGFNTYDSCYRARAIFGVNSVTVISQGYHLPRAITTCSGLGIKTIGVVASHPTRDFTLSYIAREFLSTDKMVLQLATKPDPTVLGKPEYIK